MLANAQLQSMDGGESDSDLRRPYFYHCALAALPIPRPVSEVEAAFALRCPRVYPSRCAITARERFHLRPGEQPEAAGPELPAATALELLARGLDRRGATRMYRVRVVASGAMGSMFLASGEVPAGCVLPDGAHHTDPRDW